MALGGTSTIQELSFPGGTGRWETRRTTFWQGGTRHELLVLSDLSQPLRDQERRGLASPDSRDRPRIEQLARADQVDRGQPRVAARSRSPAGRLARRHARGLGIVASRADALSRFTSAYARLARLPAPTRKTLAFGELMRRVVGLDPRLPVTLDGCFETTLSADADQLEQLLINLLRNATDAALETGGSVAATG